MSEYPDDLHPINAPTAFNAAGDPFSDFAYPQSTETREVLLSTQLQEFTSAFARGDMADTWARAYDLMGLSTREKQHVDLYNGIQPDEDTIFIELQADEMFAQMGVESNPFEIYNSIQPETTLENLQLRQIRIRDALKVLGRGAYHNTDEENDLVKSGQVREQEGFFVLGRDMDVIAHPELSTNPANNGKWHRYVYGYLSQHGFRMLRNGNAPLLDFLQSLDAMPEARKAIAMVSGVGYEATLPDSILMTEPQRRDDHVGQPGVTVLFSDRTEPLSRDEILDAAAAARNIPSDTGPFFITAETGVSTATDGSDGTDGFTAELRALTEMDADAWEAYLRNIGRTAAAANQSPQISMPNRVEQMNSVSPVTTAGLPRRVPQGSEFRPGSFN